MSDLFAFLLQTTEPVCAVGIVTNEAGMDSLEVLLEEISGTDDARDLEVMLIELQGHELDFHKALVIPDKAILEIGDDRTEVELINMEPFIVPYSYDQVAFKPEGEGLEVGG